VAELTFDPLVHAYALDGVRLQSVTQTLKAAGLIDFSKIPQPILLAARDRGTAVHKAAHYWLEGDLDVDDFTASFSEYAGYLQSLIALFSTGQLKTVACERRLASARYQYAGTMDWIGEFNGVGAILDWATGSPSDCAKDLQIAAYEGAAREWATLGEDAVLAEFFATHPRIKRIAVRLQKDGRLPKLEPYTNPRHFREFTTLLAAQQIVAGRKGQWIDVVGDAA
jgi:hypothetical protein